VYDASPKTRRLTGLVIRLPREDYERLRTLCVATRVRQSEYLREAISDLLGKYSHLL
jgi:predicted DNA-binding protein